jgi:hypothetical protein
MFDSLDEQMKHDDQAETTPRQRMLKWATIGVVSVAVFSALYIGLRVMNP